MTGAWIAGAGMTRIGRRTATVFSGVLPFMWADVVRLILLVAFPWLSLWLPSLMR